MTIDATSDRFAGFWIRVVASLIDSVIVGLIAFPLLWAIYGPEYFESEAMLAGPADFLITWVAPAFAIILLWIFKESTPGKMAFGIRIVDASTGKHASTGQYVGRYFGYFVSTIPLGLGLLWVAFDERKQGWHDKLAGTVVIRSTRPAATPNFRRYRV